jgi:hypothetical protein
MMHIGEAQPSQFDNLLHNNKISLTIIICYNTYHELMICISYTYNILSYVQDPIVFHLFYLTLCVNNMGVATAGAS